VYTHTLIAVLCGKEGSDLRRIFKECSVSFCTVLPNIRTFPVSTVPGYTNKKGSLCFLDFCKF